MQWISEPRFVDPAIWLALGAGLAVVLGFVMFGRRKRPAGPVLLPAGSPDWEDPPSSIQQDDRRRSIRRGGLPTPIVVVEARRGKKVRPAEAYVLDRSTGGLRLAMQRPVQVGSVLLAKPSNAPPGFEWVKITIRNCREIGDYYEVGCQFETDLELSRLLMFG